jgi:hypothetical protein
MLGFLPEFLPIMGRKAVDTQDDSASGKAVLEPLGVTARACPELAEGMALPRPPTRHTSLYRLSAELGGNLNEFTGLGDRHSPDHQMAHLRVSALRTNWGNYFTSSGPDAELTKV